MNKPNDKPTELHRFINMEIPYNNPYTDLPLLVSKNTCSIIPDLHLTYKDGPCPSMYLTSICTVECAHQFLNEQILRQANEGYTELSI